MPSEVKSLESILYGWLESPTLSWDSAFVELKGYDEFPNESIPKISDSVPSIYDVATEGSNVPKGKGASP